MRLQGYVNGLSEAIRRYRVENQVSNKEVAKLVGLTWKGVGNLERGTNLPSFLTLQAFARLFGWTYEEVGQVVCELPDGPQRFAVGPDRPGNGLVHEGPEDRNRRDGRQTEDGNADGGSAQAGRVARDKNSETSGELF